MATSSLRPADSSKSARRAHRRLTSNSGGGGHGRWYLIGGAAVIVLIAIAAIAYVFSSSSGTLTASSTGLAKVGLPLGGGTVERVTVLDSRNASLVPVELRGDPTIWPKGKIPAHERMEIEVTIKRPGWISWLSGKTEHLKLSVTAPSASLRSDFVTVKHGTPLVLHFKSPVATFAYGVPGHMTHRTFATPQSAVTVPTTATAGTIEVKATPRRWESGKDAAVSYFPAGGSGTAVASPDPGKQIKPNTDITLTLNKTISKVFGSHLPAVSPAGSGSWKTLSSHSIEFVPSGYGYGLAATVTMALPSGVRVVGGSQTKDSTGASWTVPQGSTLRLQQLLAQLGYLPFKFVADKTVANTPQAQEEAAVNPPKGSLNWAYPNVPSQLTALWTPGQSGTMTQGAIMAFENNNGLSTDGVPGATVWRTLINDVDTGKGGSTFGYSYVLVHEASSGESIDVWHNGKIAVTGAVNTGISAAPTATGIYPVFEHVPVTTMTGLNPDGTPYSDPGIQWVSYFNGGDALHEFPRGSYGFPQSLGCVEMPLAQAAAVYPYTPIGTLVDVL
jgi:peptidoglycan hydrolase-like protein with peptidoglycan-binding domain